MTAVTEGDSRWPTPNAKRTPVKGVLCGNWNPGFALEKVKIRRFYRRKTCEKGAKSALFGVPIHGDDSRKAKGHPDGCPFGNRTLVLPVEQQVRHHISLHR